MSSINVVLKSGASLTIILSNQAIERANSCSIRQIMYGTEANCNVLRKPPPAYFKEIRLRYPMIHIIDPNEVICRNDKCVPIIENVLLYRDSGHLNDVGSRLIGKIFVKIGARL
jgi:hypothetical protein